MNLNFKMSELIRSDIANQYKINNMPDINSMDNMLYLIFYILQPTRNKFGRVDVTGCFRSYQLWKKMQELGLNPAKNSQHLTGQAVDIQTPYANLKEVFYWIRENLDYDQLLYEFDSKGNIWIHVSYNKNKNRKQAIDNYKAA